MSSVALTEIAPSPNQSLYKHLISDNIKTKLNLGLNGAAATANLLTCINGNFPLLESLQENMEWGSSMLAKFATASQGLINSTIAFEKKNIIALTGGLLELPIAIFTSGFNLFLARGLSAGLNHIDSIISRTKKRKEDGNTIKDTLGNEQYYDDFKKEGWGEGFKVICKHIPKLTKEVYTKNFQKEELFPRSFFLCSAFMIIGSLTGFLGLNKLGAIIRHSFGGLAGVALATDQTVSTNIKSAAQINEGKEIVQQKRVSNYAMSGVLWVLAAIPDVVKHFDFFSDKLNNWTELALCLDRLAGIFFVFGNQRKGEK